MSSRRHPIVILLVVIACAALAHRAAAEEGHAYKEYEDGLGRCRQYVQTNAHWNHSTIMVDESFARDRTYVSMNVTANRAGAVKVRVCSPPALSPGSARTPPPTDPSLPPLLSPRRPSQLVLRAKRGEDLQQVRLKSYGHGGRGKNFVETSFDDAAAEHFPVWPEEAPFTGSFEPDVHLAKILGSSQGKWTLLALNRDGHTPEINAWTLTFCENKDSQGLGDLATAQAFGGVSYTPAGPATKPVVTYPAPQQWDYVPKPVYRGPNLFSKYTLGNFWRGAARTVIETVRNYNEAMFYVNQVQTIQDKAYHAGQAAAYAYHAAKQG